MKNSKILIVEDDFTSLFVIKKILEKEEFITIPVDNVEDALLVLKRESIDLIITDWMMPNIDGIEFLYRLKASFTSPPPVIIVTALTSEMAKDYALRSGAIEFISKPIEAEKFIKTVERILLESKTCSEEEIDSHSQQLHHPPFIPVCFLSGNGGTKVVADILDKLKDYNESVSYFIIQQGNQFLIDSLFQQLDNLFPGKVIIPNQMLFPKKANIYIAPFDFHILFNANYELVLDKGPKENYHRPSAEPLFRSLVKFFGKFAITVVLSGLGSDGVQGAIQLARIGGTIICQEPKSAIAPSLPKSFIASSVNPIVLEPSKIPDEIKKIVEQLKLSH